MRTAWDKPNICGSSKRFQTHTTLLVHTTKCFVNTLFFGCWGWFIIFYSKQ
jgi:hypothetical protein